jgi:predicted kinase
MTLVFQRQGSVSASASSYRNAPGSRMASAKCATAATESTPTNVLTSITGAVASPFSWSSLAREVHYRPNMRHGLETRQDGVPRMFVMVGLPAAGKTSRARELASKWSALRLTPDEWMIPLFGQEQPEGKRNILEGRLIWLALSALRIGVNVVLDFGVWGKDERSALRALAASAGATSELVYLPVDEEEQWRRVRAHSITDAASRFEMTQADLDRWRQIFQPPDAAELATGHIDPPPAGFDSWEAWVAVWWPSSLPGHGSGRPVLD